MKKTLITYLVIPGILLAAFLFFYLGAVKDMEQRAEKQKIEKAEKAADDLKRKKIIEEKANADALKRQQVRDAEDAAKLAKKEADYQAVMTQLSNETADLNTQADKLAKEVGERLEIGTANRDRAAEHDQRHCHGACETAHVVLAPQHEHDTERD